MRRRPLVLTTGRQMCAVCTAYRTVHNTITVNRSSFVVPPLRSQRGVALAIKNHTRLFIHLVQQCSRWRLRDN
jgi:hypothetical protein